jgi:hypothetical protein
MVVSRRFNLSSVIGRMVAGLAPKCIRRRLPPSRFSVEVTVDPAAASAPAAKRIHLARRN